MEKKREKKLVRAPAALDLTLAGLMGLMGAR